MPRHKHLTPRFDVEFEVRLYSPKNYGNRLFGRSFQHSSKSQNHVDGTLFARRLTELWR